MIPRIHPNLNLEGRIHLPIILIINEAFGFDQVGEYISGPLGGMLDFFRLL